MKEGNKKRYIIQHKRCGGVLCKTETGLSYNTQIKCPKCGKVVEIPEEVMTTLDRDPEFTKINKTEQ